MLPGSAGPARELRRFGLGAAFGACLLAAAWSGVGPLALWLSPNLPIALTLVGVAGALAATALLRPTLLAPLRQVLAWVGGPIAAALVWLALALFFFAVVSPIALVLRATGRDPLLLRRDSKRDSYWQTPKARDKHSYFRQS